MTNAVKSLDALAFTAFSHVWPGRGKMVENHLGRLSAFWGSGWDKARENACWMMRVQTNLT